MQSQTQKVKKTDIVVRPLRESDSRETTVTVASAWDWRKSRVIGPIGGRSHLERSPPNQKGQSPAPRGL